MKFKLFASVCVAAGLAFGLAGCGDDNAPKSGDAKTLTVGASPVPHADILNLIAPQLQKEGITLKVIEFSDYIQPNLSLNDKELDANFFQHKPYLDSYNETASESEQLVSAFTVHYEPFAIYSKKVTSLADLQDGAHIGLPNDPSNETRALLLLEAAGLITVPEGTTAASSLTKYDITAEMNPHGYVFDEVAAELLAPTLEDYDIAVINGNYALDAGLKPTTNGLFVEAADSEFATLYANIVAVRPADLDSDWLKALHTALTSKEAYDYMITTYEGGVIPTFTVEDAE